MTYNITLVVTNIEGVTNHLHWMEVPFDMVTEICDGYVDSDFKIVSLTLTRNER